MSVAFTTQLNFDWAQDTSAQAPVVIPAPVARKAEAPVVRKSDMPQIKKVAASGRAVNLGVPATAKPMDEILGSMDKAHSAARRNRTDHISDLLLVVLDKYGINADEFLATLND